MNCKIGEVWYAKFPLEENPSEYLERPVIIADVLLPNLIVIKITTHEPRKYDPFDTPIVFYKSAGLLYQSTARISKIAVIEEKQLIKKAGTLHSLDYRNIFDYLHTFLYY